MSRPPTPQFVETAQGWAWTWRTWEGLPDPTTGRQVEHEYELEWLRNDEQWHIRSRYDRAGWTDALGVDLDDPESFDHADSLAREFAERGRGGPQS